MAKAANDKAPSQSGKRRALERALRDTSAMLEQTNDVTVRRSLREIRGTLWQCLAAIEEEPRPKSKRARPEKT